MEGKGERRSRRLEVHQISRVSPDKFAVLTVSTTSQRPSFAYQVDTAIAASISLPQLVAAEDSDSWLEVSPDELDGMMMRASGRETGDTARKVELGEEHGQALQDLAKKVEQFVGGEGDIQGARFEE